MDSFKVCGYPQVTEISRIFVGYPSVPATKGGGIDTTHTVTIVARLLFIDDGIVAVDSGIPMVMRNGECKDLAVDCVLATDMLEKLNETPHGYTCAMHVLSISDLKWWIAAFDLACQEREI